ncbi:MAG TPA: amidohydrolase [Tahibacter sp.]|nr:amidohydrolase [Tahibacter sp.]
MSYRLLCAALLSFGGIAAANAAGGILVNAKIRTMDDGKPTADALAWDDAGRIVAVGTREEIASKYPEATSVDANGAAVVPGLIDAHAHVLGLGLSLLDADLRGTRSKAEILERLRAHAKLLPGKAWVVGRGWDQNAWERKEFPTAADLDTAFPDRPVALERIDGHATWINTAAMHKIGRSLDGDWQPDGGRIVRADGKATGVLVDGAAQLVGDAMPAPDAALKRKAYRLAFNDLVANGITGVHDAGVSLDDLNVLRELADAGDLPLRLYAMADADHAALDALCKNGLYAHASGRLQMRAVKLYMDGALGSRGAALLADYSDDPGNRGILVTSPEELLRIARKAKGCGVQVATHAIGDRGNRLALDAYAAALGDDATKTDHRWRIEHAQVVDLADIPRFAQLKLTASMQPTHATSDMPWAQARLGEKRLAGAYAWQRFVKAGVPLALGSDFPVEKVSPLLGLYAAITREDLDGKPAGGWLPQQRLTREQALAGFTRDAAKAQFAEKELGALAPGMRADFVLLDADPLTAPEAKLPALKIVATYVDGRVAGRGTP